MINTLRKIGEEATKYLRELHENKGIDEIIGYHQGDTTRRVDKFSEQYIFDLLDHSGYKFSFVSEESGSIFRENYEYIAIIDPLDGSTNYITGIPWSSVSIAIYKKIEEEKFLPYAGIVAEVFGNNIYSYDENGAYINSVKVDKRKPTDKIVLPYYNKDKINEAYSIISKVGNGIKIRTLGSASLDMILVCTGRAYLYFDIRGKLRNVDIASSKGFCEKLGIRSLDLKGREVTFSLKYVDVVPEIIVTSDSELQNSFSSYS